MDDVAAAAVDLGSSAGRVVLGAVRDGVLRVREVHRFPHRALEHDGTLSWDLTGLESQIQVGLQAAASGAPTPVGSVAVDTWGVDYVLVGHDGLRLGPGHTYRDPRTAAIAEVFYARMSAADRWAGTGVQPADINTANQLAAELAAEPDLVDRVGSVLLLPDWFAYRLGGTPGWSRSIASTTGLCRPGAAEWSAQVLATDGVPASWFGPISPDGEERGRWTLDPGVRVASAGHDTACAVHALPLEGSEPVAFVAAGSWSVVGLATAEPIVTSEAFHAGLTNEARLDGGNRLLANLTGLWILQECQRQWRDEGRSVEIAELVEAARQVRSPGVLLDPADPVFVPPGSMATRVADVLGRLGVRVLDPPTITRIVLESLAHSYAVTLARLEKAAGLRVATVHLVGGGSQNSLLCELTAQATGRRVLAGPSEATSIGNVLVQLEAAGVLSSAGQRADLVRRSFPPVEYLPETI